VYSNAPLLHSVSWVQHGDDEQRTSNRAFKTANGLSKKPTATRVHAPDARLASGISFGSVEPLSSAVELGAASEGNFTSRARTD
jgi:hypothetical protein